MAIATLLSKVIQEKISNKDKEKSAAKEFDRNTVSQDELDMASAELAGQERAPNLSFQNSQRPIKFGRPDRFRRGV